MTDGTDPGSPRADWQAHFTRPLTYEPPAGHIPQLYADDDLIVADKPSGLLTVPGRLPAHQDSLITRLASDFGELHCVHRLDLETSGIIVFARHKEALRQLNRQFSERTVRKTYHAVVSGIPDAESGEVSLPLICDWPARPRQMVDHARGKPSLTRWKRVASQPENRRSLLELTPVTGRSHQLRVHLAASGHPVFGDPLYAPDAIWQASDRLELYATMLELIHPVSGKALTFSLTPPALR